MTVSARKSQEERGRLLQTAAAPWRVNQRNLMFLGSKNNFAYSRGAEETECDLIEMMEITELKDQSYPFFSALSEIGK